MNKDITINSALKAFARNRNT